MRNRYEGDTTAVFNNGVACTTAVLFNIGMGRFSAALCDGSATEVGAAESRLPTARRSEVWLRALFHGSGVRPRVRTAGRPQTLQITGRICPGKSRWPDLPGQRRGDAVNNDDKNNCSMPHTRTHTHYTIQQRWAWGSNDRPQSTLFAKQNGREKY